MRSASKRPGAIAFPAPLNKIRLLLTIPPNLNKQFSHLAIFGDIYCMLVSMNKQEAAEFLGVSVRALERYVQQGRIGGHYEKGKTRPTLVFDKAELEVFKAELEQKLYKPAVESSNPDNPDKSDKALARLSENSSMQPELAKSEHLATLIEALLNVTRGRFILGGRTPCPLQDSCVSPD